MKQGVMLFIAGLVVLIIGICVILEIPGTGVGGSIIGMAYVLGVCSGLLMGSDNR